MRFIFTIASGKPTGEAYVEFENAEVAREAMKSRQKYHIGTRYIEVSLRLLLVRQLTLDRSIPCSRSNTASIDPSNMYL